MTREIKFRAWDKGRKCWYDWHNVRQSSFDEYIDVYGEPEIGDWVLVQYTGLKDKNGKEIYEGDVVRRKQHESFIDTGIATAVVDDMRWIYRIIDTALDEIEVIGNIYENPDLLSPKP